jgi:DNA-binding transcriptional regulator YiaG
LQGGVSLASNKNTLFELKIIITMTRPKKNQPQQTDSPFKKLRLNAHLSQEQLAREIGVAVSTVRRWEKGQAEPTMTVLQMKNFCRAVNQTLEEIPDSLLPGMNNNK